MIKVAIVEDEEESILQIQSYIEQYGKENQIDFLIDVFRDGSDIIKDYEPRYDIILLDIEMPHVNGMEAARIIRTKDNNVVLVFITNMAQYAIDGYSVRALDFILKPIDYYVFSLKFTRAMERAAKYNNTIITLKLLDGVKRLNIRQIYYVEIQNRVLHYHTKSGEYIIRGTMKSAEEELCKYHFEKCNYWYLVNLKYVSEIRGNTVVVAGKELEISRRNRTAFLTAVTNYIGGNS
jgi:DNA-binding LytR/AlgR family response regulator